MALVELLTRVKLRKAWYEPGTVLEVDAATCEHLLMLGCALESPEPAEETLEDVPAAAPEGKTDNEGTDGEAGGEGEGDFGDEGGDGEAVGEDEGSTENEGGEEDPLAGLAEEAAAAAAEVTPEGAAPAPKAGKKKSAKAKE